MKDRKEVVYHVDAESAKHQVYQHLLYPIGLEVGLLVQYANRNFHLYHIGRTASEEQFKLFGSAIGHHRYVTEAKECHRISYKKYRKSISKMLSGRTV